MPLSRGALDDRPPPGAGPAAPRAAGAAAPIIPPAARMALRQAAGVVGEAMSRIQQPEWSSANDMPLSHDVPQGSRFSAATPDRTLLRPTPGGLHGEARSEVTLRPEMMELESSGVGDRTRRLTPIATEQNAEAASPSPVDDWNTTRRSPLHGQRPLSREAPEESRMQTFYVPPRPASVPMAAPQDRPPELERSLEGRSTLVAIEVEAMATPDSEVTPSPAAGVPLPGASPLLRLLQDEEEKDEEADEDLEHDAQVAEALISGDDAHGAIARTGVAESDEDANAEEYQMEGERVPCATCGRSFAPAALARHNRICSRTFGIQRRQFDIAGQRRAEGAAPLPRAERRTAEVRPAQNHWRAQSEAFRQAMRAGRQVQAHLAAGRPVQDLPPPPPVAAELDHRIECPYCGRRFNRDVAERHIPRCANIAARPQRLVRYRPVSVPPMPGPAAPVEELPRPPADPRPPGLTQDELMRAQQLWAAPLDRLEECAVCLADPTASSCQEVMVLPCQHAFHAPCICRWLVRQCLCVLCRQDVRPGLRQQRSASVPALARRGRGSGRSSGHVPASRGRRSLR